MRATFSVTVVLSAVSLSFTHIVASQDLFVAVSSVTLDLS